MPNPSHRTARRQLSRERRAGTRLSRMVTRRLEDAQELVGSIRKHKVRIAAALRERLEPALRAGETLPDHELELELRARTVETAIDRLVELDDRRDQARAMRNLASREVSRRAQDLYPEAVDVRREIDAAFGREIGAGVHSFTGKTARKPSDLLLHVERALARLEDPASKLPAETRRGRPVNLGDWTERLRKPYDDLVEAERILRERQSALGNLQLERKRAMEDYDALYARTLELVEAEFKEAGLGGHILANLRPYYRRRRMRSQARKKREIRAESQDATAPAPAESVGAESEGGGQAEQQLPLEEAPLEEEDGAPEGAVATISRWLKKSRASG